MIILVTGGTRSGKSTYGESLLSKMDKILYIATGPVTDEEMKERVQLHQERRGSRYTTYEGYRKIGQAILDFDGEHTMIECVGTMITNIMFEHIKDFDNISKDERKRVEEDALAEWVDIVKSLKNKKGTHLIITNEVGFSLISEYPSGRLFVDILGRINQMIAKEADQVILCVSGIPMTIKP